jgi:hypothetical protein
MSTSTGVAELIARKRYATFQNDVARRSQAQILVFPQNL